MVVALLILLSCELLGDALRAVLCLPIPGTVIGMLLLTAILTLMGPRPATAGGSALDRTAGTLLAFMGLLFVPAGVGIIAQGDLLRAQWLPIVGSVVGSTVLSLAVTAAVMHALGRRQGDARASEPRPSA